MLTLKNILEVGRMLEQTGEHRVSTTKENERRLESFRKEAIGKTIEYVRREFALHGWSVRTMVVDGKNCMGTCDLRQDRVNVEVRDGKVVDVLSIG